MANLTGLQIKEKILARESFWVATPTERMRARTIATTLGIKYITTAAGRSGFYICHIPKISKTK